MESLPITLQQQKIEFSISIWYVVSVSLRISYIIGKPIKMFKSRIRNGYQNSVVYLIALS